MTLIPSLTFTDYDWFPWSICNRCGMPAGNAYPSGHLVPSPIVGLACATIVEIRFLELAMSLLDFSPRIPLGTFSILLSTHPVHLYPVQVSHILYGACDLRGFNGSLRSAITETKSARNHKHVDRDVVIGVRLLYISVSLQILLIHLLILLINLIISNIIH